MWIADTIGTLFVVAGVFILIWSMFSPRDGGG